MISRMMLPSMDPSAGHLRILHGGWSEQWLCLPAHEDRRRRLSVPRTHALIHQNSFAANGHPIAGLNPDPTRCPCTRLHNLSGGGPGIGGIQALAIEGMTPRPLHGDGRLCGFVCEDDLATWCWLTDLVPPATGSVEQQAEALFDLLGRCLGAAGLAWSDLVRTWYFNHDILAWYDIFNRVRTACFRHHGIFDGLVPASTGVGMPNVHGSALVVNAWAVRPKDDRVRLREVVSPLQCPAPTYGSSFSRAVEITTPQHRRLTISGTASIAPDGRSAHRGDIDAQISLTMEVVEAILASCGLGWADATRAIAYFRDGADAPRLHAWCSDHGVAGLPVVCAEAIVCRDDLLFEMEIDACRAL